MITRFNDKDIQSAHDLTLAVTNQKPGTTATLGSNRGGSARQVTLTIGQRTDDEIRTSAIAPTRESGDQLGLSLSPIPEEALQQLGLQPSTAGVFVQDVAPDSLAADNGLQAGDVIVSANGQTVTQPPDIEKQWANSRQQNRPILFRINRQGQFLFVAVARS
ncbi:PDZ domain-containing protein [Rhizobium leguminosarum]|uniref:PDZ domain-containing protein n=1 Tax=Rhizobium leguminosarum TaxID=384 RepID=UPI0003A8A1F0|nr:PDZ domain-containing protein [Rhizobium leguminosarum]